MHESAGLFKRTEICYTSSMQIEKDESFGIIPVRETAEGYEVLLINQISRKGQTFWTLPKGHKEDDETVTEAAARELAEETGLSDVVIKSTKKFSMHYQFQHDDTTIDKTVYFYLGIVRSGEPRITQPREVAALAWLSFDEAIERATHDAVKLILKETKKKLR